jgi:hypothetical protein
VTVAFIGGGFAGLVTGARLKEAGVDDVRILDKAGDFGGTWYWNRYPGAQCDTASFVYMPLLEETGYMPTEKYAHAPEILEHCRASVGTSACTTTPRSTRGRRTWCGTRRPRSGPSDEPRRRDDRPLRRHGDRAAPRPQAPWHPRDRVLRRPLVPHQPLGLRYTGGDPAGAPMVGLADKRVAIIGTGATAVQCVPHLARACKELYVFQRTPSRSTSAQPADRPEWFATIATPAGSSAGWTTSRQPDGGHADEDLVMDGWTDLSGGSARRSWPCRARTSRPRR